MKMKHGTASMIRLGSECRKEDQAKAANPSHKLSNTLGDIWLEGREGRTRQGGSRQK